MARKPRRSRTRAVAGRRRRHSTLELLMAGLGGLVLILVVGMIVAALVQGD